MYYFILHTDVKLKLNGFTSKIKYEGQQILNGEFL